MYAIVLFFCLSCNSTLIRKFWFRLSWNLTKSLLMMISMMLQEKLRYALFLPYLPCYPTYLSLSCVLNSKSWADLTTHIQDGVRSNRDESLDPKLLQQYAIGDRDADFENALQNGDVNLPAGGLVSVKSSRNRTDKGKERESHKSGEKRRKNEHGSSSKSNKKKKHWH